MGGAVMFDSTQLTSVTDTTMARGGFGQGQQLPECSAQYEHYAQCCCGGHTSSSLPSRPTLCSLPTGPCLPPGAGNVGFSGGAISAQLAGDVRLTRVRLIDNYSASFAGAALVWGSNLTIIDSDVSNVSVPMGVGGSFRCQNKQSEYSRSRAGHSAPVEAVSAPRLCPALLSCRPAGLLPPPPALCPRPPPPAAEHRRPIWWRHPRPVRAVQCHQHPTRQQLGGVGRRRRPEAAVGRGPGAGLRLHRQQRHLRRRHRGHGGGAAAPGGADPGPHHHLRQCEGGWAGRVARRE